MSLLVIGGSSIIGRRLRALAAGYAGKSFFSSATRPAEGDLCLNALEPSGFCPPDPISRVIICIPIWLVTDALLSRLTSLGMKRLIAFSSTSLFTKSKTKDPHEQEMVAGLAGSEKRVRDHCEAHGIHWTLLRPTMIYDEGHDRNVTQIANVIRRLGFFPVAGAARGLRRPVHAEDLAKAALQSLDCPAAFGKSYTLSGADILTYREMVQRIFQGMSRRPVILPLPLFIWRAGFLLKGMLRPGGTNIEMALRMNQDMNFDHEAAAQAFGYNPRAFHPRF